VKRYFLISDTEKDDIAKDQGNQKKERGNTCLCGQHTILQTWHAFGRALYMIGAKSGAIGRL